jgi:hypothetical protein
VLIAIQLSDLKVALETLRDAAALIAFLFGAGWAWFKINEYRQFKNWIQFDVDARIFKLESLFEAKIFTWDKAGNRIEKKLTCTHGIEVELTFTNKGSTRLRLFNIQLGLNTMRSSNDAQFDEGDGHVHLTRMFTSGNLVPEMPVKGLPVEKTSYYYIEPSVTQAITFFTLIPAPREFIQVYAEFNMAQKRLFPKSRRLDAGLYPHSVGRVFKVEN